MVYKIIVGLFVGGLFDGGLDGLFDGLFSCVLGGSGPEFVGHLGELTVDYAHKVFEVHGSHFPKDGGEGFDGDGGREDFAGDEAEAAQGFGSLGGSGVDVDAALGEDGVMVAEVEGEVVDAEVGIVGNVVGRADVYDAVAQLLEVGEVVWVAEVGVGKVCDHSGYDRGGDAELVAVATVMVFGAGG